MVNGLEEVIDAHEGRVRTTCPAVLDGVATAFQKLTGFQLLAVMESPTRALPVHVVLTCTLY
jgi:hypothetical protein